MSTAEKRVVALEKELSKLNMIVEAQERDRDSWLQARELEIKMSYKAKKESLRA